MEPRYTDALIGHQYATSVKIGWTSSVILIRLSSVALLLTMDNADTCAIVHSYYEGNLEHWFERLCSRSVWLKNEAGAVLRGTRGDLIVRRD